MLELGAGTSLPSLVSGYCGSKHVIITDLNDGVIMDNCHAIVNANVTVRDKITVTPLVWGEFPSSVLSLPVPDIIIGADIFYDFSDAASQYENVVASMYYFVSRNKACEVIVAYHRRSNDTRLENILRKYKMTVVHVVDSAHFLHELLCPEIDGGSNRYDSIQILIIRSVGA
jgi:predicted nicotinamide N-methyase